jgi:hypothetical protein
VLDNEVDAAAARLIEAVVCVGNSYESVDRAAFSRNYISWRIILPFRD